MILLPFHTYVWHILKLPSLEGSEHKPANVVWPIIIHEAMLCHGQRLNCKKTMSPLVTLLQGCGCALLSSPVLSEQSQACLSPGRDCRQQQRTAGPLSCCQPRAADLSSCDHHLDPPTYLSLPQSLAVDFLPTSTKGKGCRQKFTHKQKL